MLISYIGKFYINTYYTINVLTDKTRLSLLISLFPTVFPSNINFYLKEGIVSRHYLGFRLPLFLILIAPPAPTT